MLGCLKYANFSYTLILDKGKKPKGCEEIYEKKVLKEMMHNKSIDLFCLK